MLKKIVSIALLLLCAMALLVSCGAGEENVQIKEYSKTFIDALITNDPDSAYVVVKDAISREDFTPIFDNMRRHIGTNLEYTLTQTRLSEGNGSVTATLEMKTAEHTYKVVASTTQGKEGLSGFQILILDPDKTGTLTTMKGANALQWIVLIIAIAEIGFILWMLVDCILHRVQRKATWIIFILLGLIAVSYTWSDAGTSVDLTLGYLWNLSMLAKYETGATVLRLMLPVGAVIYAIMRRNLILPPQDEQKPQPEAHSLHNEDDFTQNN